MTSTINFSTSYGNKGTGANQSNTLTAEEWNGLMSDLNTVVGEIPTSSGSGNSVVTVTDVTVPNGDATANVAVVSGVSEIGSPNVIQLTKKKKGVNTTLVSGNNINIEPRESVGETKGGNISFKPGDDIEFCSHHRLTGNQDEVTMKVINGSDEPVKLQLNASEMTLTTKDKTGNNSNVFDINVNSGKNQKGYLKVRAQAIDLRCEEHGGIALQPKGEDGDGHQNKIKFEHGGGDGLEFGTFNTEKTSIFTDEYRFKKDGVWKMATRTTTPSDKYDNEDETTHYNYVKQSDDFYDIIAPNDPTTTTKDIIYAGNLVANISTGTTVNNGTITRSKFLGYRVDSVTQTESGSADYSDNYVYNSFTNAVNTVISASTLEEYIDDSMPIDWFRSSNTVTFTITGPNGDSSTDRYIVQVTKVWQTSSCTFDDIIDYVMWAKTNNEGPWAA